MEPSAIAGFLCAWLLAYLAVGTYCLASYARRPREPGFLAFGLLSFALAVMNAGAAWHYVTHDPLASPGALTIATAGRIAATAFLVHFVLDYAEVDPRRKVVAVVYGLAGVFELANLAGFFFEFERARHQQLRLFGVVLTELDVPQRVPAVAFAVFSVAAVLGTSVVLARAFMGGRREGLGSFLGTAALSVTVIHDALRSFGWVGSLALAPYGYAAFVLGVIVTLLSRYASLRDNLEARTAELKRRSRELRRSYEELREAQSELVKKEQLAAVGELSAVIAHEVRNPLAIINNAVATLRRASLGAEDRETLLGILDEESSRLNRLVGDLLRYARPVAIERQHLCLRELVERALSIARGRPDVTVELQAPEAVPRIWGDAGLLRQVIENLVNNALQAMAGGGVLSVTLSPLSVDGIAGVELQIQDTGEGMDTTVRNRALDPFFTTRASGTGLGLAIVARFVDAHGGRLHIRSAAGDGTVLHVFLPIASDSAPVMSPRRPRGSEPAVPQPAAIPPAPREIRKAVGGE